MNNDPKMWRVWDPSPRKCLDDFVHISDKALAFYARNKDCLNDYHTQLYGSIDMLKGLDYHHKNLAKYTKKLNIVNEQRWAALDHKKKIQLIKRESGIYQSCTHEITAYLNQLYQFSNFYESELAQVYVSKCKKKSCKNALLFRNNWTKIRQTDSKRIKEDDKAQALYSGFGLGRDIGKPLQIRIQISLERKGTIDFWAENEHKEIMNEAYCIFMAVFNGLSKA